MLNRRAAMEIYRNETQNVGHWLAVVLLQEGGNRNAIGARVTVGAEMQHLTIGGGHAGGQALPLHFGLGDATEVEVTVEWPNGQLSKHRAQADQTITLQP